MATVEAPQAAIEPLASVAARGRELEMAGRWQEADRLYASLFRRALAERDPSAAVDALRRQASVRGGLGQMEEAEELAELSFEIAERCGLGRAAARAINVRATLLHVREELSGAAALYREALARARAVRDDELTGLVCQNLGVIANIQGELAEARALYLECIASTIRSGDRTAAMMAYNNLGLVCADLREWLEAELYLERALDVAERIGHLPTAAFLHLNLAEPLIQMGELRRARATLDRAEELAAPIGDRGTLAAARRFRAVIARIEGDFAAADRDLEDAAAMVVGEGDELERAQILGAVARLRWEQGRRDEARDALHRARDCFAALGAAREIRRLDEVLEGWGEGVEPGG
ncbi:MAG TPA: tetratricopeptide repeat protein [Longimicrobium sp.]|jgi:tetratricopeptide (TPR) repeat protein